MANNIIETFDLSKTYKIKGNKIHALRKANLSIEEGEIFGLLGPNGAGKTTMLSILTTLIQPTSGYAVIDGFHILKNTKQVRAKVGLMLDSKMLYFRMTGYKNLKFFCKIYKIPDYKEKIFSIAKEFGLENWLNQYVEKYSQGMKMKLALCRTLLLNRKILFLDEPTLGLDVKSTSFIVNKLINIKKTIFLTSHNMSVVEKLCTRIAFIDKGNILNIGTKKEIKRIMQIEIKIEIEIVKNKNQLKSELNQQDFVNKIIDTKEGLVIFLKERKSYKYLFQIFSKYEILKIKEQEPSFEDLFLDNLNKLNY